MKWQVPKEWMGETCIILGGGTSITRTNWPLLEGHKVIAINERYLLYPQSDVLYFCDYFPMYENNYRTPEFQAFEGMKVTIAPQLLDDLNIYALCQGEEQGLSLDPTTLCHGANSGYQAINLAVLLGAARILLLGYDMQTTARARHQPPFERWLKNFETIVEPLKEHGVEVINCTPESMLKIFPAMSLAEALA